MPEQQDTRPASILLEEERKELLAILEPWVINPYAAEYAEALEFEDKETLRYLDKNLILSVAKRGKRAEQVVEISNAREAARIAQERLGSPTYNTTVQAQPEKRNGVSLFARR